LPRSAERQRSSWIVFSRRLFYSLRLVDLVLYVSTASPPSTRALANVKRILARYKARKVSLTIYDVAAEPDRASRDRITFTPTLCKRAPEPPVWIVGDLSDPAALTDLLDYYGVQPAHAHRQAHYRRSRI